MNAKTVYDFDDALAIKFYHYKTVDEYYRDFSCAPRIEQVTVPVLCLSSADDPVASYHAIPFDEIKLNQNFILALSSKGGHIGWVTGFFKLKYWHTSIVCDYIQYLTKN